MKIERLITVFDNNTELLTEELNIDSIDIVQLKEIFNPPPDDPLMHNVYEVQSLHTELINQLLKNKINFDFERNAYYIECVQLPPYDFNTNT